MTRPPDFDLEREPDDGFGLQEGAATIADEAAAKSILDGLVKGRGIEDDRDVVRLGVRIEQVPKEQESASIVWTAAVEQAA